MPTRRLTASLRKRALLAVSLVLVTSGCGGSTSSDAPPESRAQESRATAGETASAPARSGTFDVGGHEMYAECTGSGSPTVVFLHGLDGTSLDWSATASLLDDTHVCRYDRRNVGQSDHVEGRHSALDAVKDLRALLPQVQAEPPYLLVGHSYGGLLALIYAGSYPEDVSGLVLADANLPVVTTLDLPVSRAQLKDRLDNNREQLDAYAGLSVARDAEKSLPDVPVVYLYALKQDFPAGWPMTEYERALRTWTEALPKGSFVECHCSHDVPNESPDQVAAEVEKILAVQR